MGQGKLRKRVVHAKDQAQGSFWLIPALLAVLAGGLAAITLWIDGRLDGLGEDVGWLFGGTAEGAWTLLQVIAGSLITVISVAFSVTLIAIQQASAQYSPHLLRNFTSDRANQMVLGTYVATFIYALLVLREVRESTEDADSFIPAVSLFVAIGLALVSLALLIFFIHHITESLQVPNLLSQIRRELDQQIDNLFPSTFSKDSTDPPRAAAILDRARASETHQAHSVCSQEEGYLKRIDESQLREVLELLVRQDSVRLAEVPVRIGQYVRPGAALLRVWSERPPSSACEERARNSFDLHQRRSVAQDPLFGIEQMVDVAVKALSPSVNDPTTAIQALDQVGTALALLQKRQWPSPARTLPAGATCVFALPDFEEFVEASLGRVRRAAHDDVGVQLHLLELLRDLAENCPSSERAAPLRHQATELLLQVEGSQGSAHDRTVLRDRVQHVLWLLEELPGS